MRGKRNEAIVFTVWPGEHIPRVAKQIADQHDFKVDRIEGLDGTFYSGPSLMVPAFVDLCLRCPGWANDYLNGSRSELVLTKEIGPDLSVSIAASIKQPSMVTVSLGIRGQNESDEVELLGPADRKPARSIMSHIQSRLSRLYERLGAGEKEAATLARSVLIKAFPEAQTTDLWAVMLKLKDWQRFDWRGQADDANHAEGVARAKAVKDLKGKVTEQDIIAADARCVLERAVIGPAANLRDQAEDAGEDECDAMRVTYRG